MEAMIVIALLALSLFGPGWSSPKKAYWEWQLGHKLEGYQEHRLARGEWNPDGGQALLSCDIEPSPEYHTGFIPPQLTCCTIFPDGSASCQPCSY